MMKRWAIKWVLLLIGSNFLVNGGIFNNGNQLHAKHLSLKSGHEYQVFAFNDLGMHCYDADFSVFSILPLFNVLHAQVVLKGREPELLNSSNVSVFYKAQRDPDKSINKTSRGKTNFWEYVQLLFGLDLMVNQGIPVPPPDGPSAWMPGVFNRLQPFVTGFDAEMKWFSVKGIPITQIDDKFQLNSYPLMSVKAFSGKKYLDSIPVVVPVSSEMYCRNCHQTGNIAARLSDTIPWSTKTDLNIQYRENILLLHDEENGTELFSNQPVLCFSCHYSAALDLAGTGPAETQIGKPQLSHAIHGYHAEEITQTQSVGVCFNCHPGPITQCLRGAMALAGNTCIDCHGNMFAVGREERQPWVDLPMCQSCHTGDAVANLDGKIIRNVAYIDSPDIATFIEAPNKRFAEETGRLYRKSRGHEGMACESCHGSPHSIWPSRERNDNLTAEDIQGHKGMIIECVVCHGEEMEPTLDGPHGMHNVDSLAWINEHEEFYEGSEANCQYCHGIFGIGTVISRAAVDRVFEVEHEGTVRIPKGTQIGCGLCHKNELAEFAINAMVQPAND